MRKLKNQILEERDALLRKKMHKADEKRRLMLKEKVKKAQEEEAKVYGGPFWST